MQRGAALAGCSKRLLETADIAQQALVQGAREGDRGLRAPFSYPPLAPCPHPELPQIVENEWGEAVSFSCESEEATQFTWAGAAVFRRLYLEAGDYEVFVTGGAGVKIVGCQTQVLHEPPEIWSNGSVPNQAEASQTSDGQFFPSGETHVLSLTSELYRFALSSGVDDIADVEISVKRVDHIAGSTP